MKDRLNAIMLFQFLCGGTALICFICLMKPSPVNAAASIFMLMLLVITALFVPISRK